MIPLIHCEYASIQAGKVEFTQTVGLVIEYQLDVSQFAKGVYLLTLANNNGKQTTKFVVE